MDNNSIAIASGYIYQTFDFFNVVFSTIAAIIVVYLFVFKRKAISSIYNLLLNYVFQISQNELLEKIKEINSLNADESPKKVTEMLFDVKGQIQGNPILAKNCDSILKRISKFQQHPDQLTNVRVKELMSELKEKIKYINIQSYNEILGEKKDE